MFSCFGLLWLLIVRSHFWPFSEVQNGNQREVTTKCGNSFKPNETKGREDSIGSLRVKDSLCSLCPFAKAFGVAFCYKDCFGEPPLRLRLAQRVDWMTVEAAVPAA